MVSQPLTKQCEFKQLFMCKGNGKQHEFMLFVNTQPYRANGMYLLLEATKKSQRMSLKYYNFDCCFSNDLANLLPCPNPPKSLTKDFFK